MAARELKPFGAAAHARLTVMLPRAFPFAAAALVAWCGIASTHPPLPTTAELAAFATPTPVVFAATPVVRGGRQIDEGIVFTPGTQQGSRFPRCGAVSTLRNHDGLHRFDYVRACSLPRADGGTFTPSDG